MNPKNRKRLWSFLLAFVLIFGTFSTGSLAAENEENETHVHTESCYAKAGELLCTIPESEGHIHDTSCYCGGGELVCTKEETTGHSHTADCLDENGEYVCGQEELEEHTHNEECYCGGGELLCGQEESEGHTHDEDCYAKGDELICNMDIAVYDMEDEEEISLFSQTEEAYVTYDLDTRVLTFQRGVVPAGTDKLWVYTGIEDAATAGSNAYPAWINDETRMSTHRVVIKDEIHPYTTAYWFSGLAMEKIEGLDKLDTSAVTTMRGMFEDSSFLYDLDLSSFNTANVEDMSDMFSGAFYLKNVNVSSFDTSKVKNFENMFGKTALLEKLDISNFDTSAAENLRDMFNQSGFKEIALGTKFSFKPATGDGTACLPDGNWVRNSDNTVYSQEGLRDTYDGTTMAGVYTQSNGKRYEHTGEWWALEGATVNTESKGGGKGYYSYCINTNIKFRDYDLYKNVVTDNTTLNYYLDYRHKSERENASKDTYQSLVKVLYYGYPNNKTLPEDTVNLKEKCGVSDEAAALMTQYAAQYFTDGRPGLEWGSIETGTPMEEYYQALIGQNPNVDLQTVNLPEDEECTLLVFSTGRRRIENGEDLSVDQNTAALEITPKSNQNPGTETPVNPENKPEESGQSNPETPSETVTTNNVETSNLEGNSENIETLSEGEDGDVLGSGKGKPSEELTDDSDVLGAGKGKTTAPQTGDTFNPIFWMTLMGLAAATLCYSVYLRKNRNENVGENN